MWQPDRRAISRRSTPRARRTADRATVAVVLAGRLAAFASATGARSFSLGLVIALALFTIAGPWVWRVDPAAQDSIRSAARPGCAANAPHRRVVRAVGRRHARDAADAGLGRAERVCGSPSPRRRRRSGSSGSPRCGRGRLPRLPQHLRSRARSRARSAARRDRRSAPGQLRGSLRPRGRGAIGIPSSRSTANGVEAQDYAVLVVDVRARHQRGGGRVARLDRARRTAVRIGDEITLPYHPLGTDYSRPRHARAAHARRARVALHRRRRAAAVRRCFGIVYGSAAGFVGRTRRPGAHARSRISSSRCRSCCS